MLERERARRLLARPPNGARCSGDRPRRSVARLALGFSHMLRREHEDAVEELRAALDLKSNFALGHACLGLALAYGAKGAEAVG